MNQQYCSPFEALVLSQASFLGSNEQDELPFPTLPENHPFEVAFDAGDTQVRRISRRPSLVAKKQFCWTSFFKDLFVSRTVCDWTGESDDLRLPDELTICWSTSDEDSDVSILPAFDEWDNDEFDSPSEEDTFCIETVLHKAPSEDEEDSVLVTWSSLE